MSAGRRTLEFASLGEVMPEVNRLLAGHETLGQWSLPQICNHLSSVIIASVDGSPFRMPWIVRKTVGPWIVRDVNKKGRFPTGIKLPEKFQPKPGLDARAEAESLRATIQLFGQHVEPLADHPLAGPISRAAWERWHCIHCAHHLSFTRPETVKAI